MNTYEDVENAALKGEEAPVEKQEEEVVPPWAQKIAEGQARLENQQQSLRRQLVAVQQKGEAPSPALLQTMANVEQMLADNQLEKQIERLNLTEEQAVEFRKLHTTKVPATTARPELDESVLAARAEQEYEEILTPKFQVMGALAGVEMTPGILEQLHNDYKNFELRVDPKTGAWINMHEFELHVATRLAATAELLQKEEPTPARAAGKTAGNGVRPSGTPSNRLDVRTTSAQELMRAGMAAYRTQGQH